MEWTGLLANISSSIPSTFCNTICQFQHKCYICVLNKSSSKLELIKRPHGGRGSVQSLPSPQKHLQRQIPKDSTGKSAYSHSQKVSKINDRCNKTRTQDTLTMDTPLTIDNNQIDVQNPNLNPDSCVSIMNSRHGNFFLPSLWF